MGGECDDLRLRLAQLERALATARVIGQAQGLVMARYGVGPDQAFEVLRRLASHANVPVRDLAADLVADPGAALADRLGPTG